jgi:hypothetical protein
MTTDESLIAQLAFLRLTRATVCILVGLLMAWVVG